MDVFKDMTHNEIPQDSFSNCIFGHMSHEINSDCNHHFKKSNQRGNTVHETFILVTFAGMFKIAI